MVVPNKRKGVEKAIGLTLVSATALTMGAGAAPAIAQTSPTKSISTALLASPSVDLGDGVVVTGPSIPYKVDATNFYWYKTGGIFKLKVDSPNINKIVVTQNGNEIVSEEFGANGPNTFAKDLTITELADLKITISSGSVPGTDIVVPEHTDPDTGLVVPETTTPGVPTKSVVTEKIFKSNFDSVAPTASGEPTNVGQDAGKSYISSDSTFSVNADDGSGVGVQGIELEKFDEVSAAWVKSRDLTSGSTFNLTVNGKYRLKTIDLLGNTATHTFLDVYGVSEDVVYVAPSASHVNYNVNGAPNTGGIYKDSAAVNFTFAGAMTTSTKIKINGAWVSTEGWNFETVARTKTIDLAGLARPADGIYTVHAETTVFGGQKFENDFVVKADFDAPTVSDATITGKYQVDGGKIYAGGGVVVSFTTSDIGSSVKSVTIEGSDAVVTTTGSTSSFTLKSGENYTVVVTDAVGHVTRKTFTELGLPSNSVVVDEKAPVVTEVSVVVPDYTDGSNNNWFSKPPVKKWTVEDDNLKSVKLTVGGKTETLTPDSAGVYSINLIDYPLTNGNRLDMTVTATDRSNNITEWSKTIFVDSDAPRDLQATVDGAYQDRPFGVFAQGKLVLNSKANDGSGVGIKTYQLVDKTGKVISEFKNGTVDIPQGELLVVVVDLVGNKSAPQTLQSLLGLKTNVIKYDSTTPKITVDHKKPTYSNWFGEDIDYTINFSDDTALFSGKVSVNGKDLAEFTSTEIETSRVLKFNTSQATANADGSYDVVVNGVDAAGNPVSWNETIKIDRIAPQIESFTFTTPGFKEGEKLTKSSDYGFFFKEATSVDIKVNDAEPTSGVKEIAYVLRNDDGSEFKTGFVSVSGDTARVDIPVGFKGYIDASATDNVLHTGEKVHPSGVITENRNWYVNTSDIQIQVVDPGKRDNKNQFLFRGDIVATVPIKQGVSGIKSIEWGIGDTTLGNASVGIDGSLTGDGFAVDIREKNLVLGVNGKLPVNGNTNDMRVWVKVIDRAGYTSDANKVVSIDKDAPIIDVTYNDTNDTSYYAANRTATVTVTERNFNPSDVKWSGKYGILSNWQNVSGDVWKASITFSEETEFNWGVSYTDLAGNIGKPYASETFTIDKTAPQLSVTFDNNSVQNGKFYKTARTALVEVIDRNFDASKVNYAGDGALGGWASNGDSHTATVTFATDGEYKFNVNAADKASNASNAFESGDFVVDTTKPAFAIEGVKNGVSYKKDVGFTVTTSDTYVDTKASFVTLVGRNNGEMKVEGGFNASTGRFELTNFPNTKEYDDLYTLSTKVVDLAGNEVKEDVIFSVNRFGSEFKFDNESLNGEYFQKLPSDIVLVQTSVDRLDMNGFSVVVLRNGEQIEVPKGSWKVKESGGEKQKWTYTITVNKDFFTEDGAYQVQMFSKAVDGTKESSMAQEYAFVIDNTKPVIYISGVEDKTVYKALEKDVTVEVRDLSGVAELAILLNDVEQPYTEENGVYKFTMPANSKSNDLFVEAKDRAGNMERAGVVEIFLTSSDIEALWHKSWVRWLVGFVGLLFAAVIALIVRGAVKRRNEDAEKQARLDAAQAASSGELYETSGALAAVNMDIPVEDAVLDISEGGKSATPSPTDSGVTEDSQATNFIDEGAESTDFLDEGDGETGHFTEGK